MSVIIFLIILLVLVVSHEFGHFIVAKKSGIRVDEFSFGFPPKLFGIKRGETTYKFNALPFGGYVKIYGQGSDDFPGQNSEKVTTESDQARSFMHKPRYIQAMVLLAGVVMNFLVAWLLLSIGFMSGLPTSSGATPTGSILANESLTIISLASGSPAEKAGLKENDIILEVDGVKLDDNTTLASIIRDKSIGQVINLKILHRGEEKTVPVTLEAAPDTTN